MHKSFAKLLLAAVAVTALLASATSALAQGITTAAINGQVTSKDGQAIAGATITIVHVPSGTKATTTSRSNGQYTMSGLRIGGPYTVTATAKDYTEQTQQDIDLEVGDSSQFNFALSPEVLKLEAFAVSSSRDTTFGAGKMGTSTSFTSQEIANTPSVRRNIQDIATLDSRITVLSLDQGGNMSVSGQNFRYNSFLVDGVQAIDPFGLNGNGFSSLRSPIPFEAIESLQVDLNPYSVSRSGFTGALINAVIKSGTNEFHGTVYGEMTNENWRAKNPVTGVRDTFDEKIWGFALGGPIIKNKLFFFLDHDDFKRTAAPPTQNFVPDQASLDAIVARAKALGYDAGNTTASNTSYQKTDIAKLDWNITDQHRLSYTYRKNKGQDTNFAEFTGATTVSLSNYWFAQPRVTTAHTVQLFSNWSPDFRTEVTYMNNKYDGSPSNMGSPFPRVQVGGVSGTNLTTGAATTGNVVFGTENSRQLNFINTTENLGRITGEYSFGNHTLAMGIEDDITDYTNKFVQNIYGNYSFSSIANWQAGTPASAYSLAKLNPGFTLDNAFAEWKYEARAIYIEDTWRPDSQLTILAGLRYDYPYVPEAPPVATGFEAAFGIPNNSTNSGNWTISPRVGFSYQFKTERKTQLRGGIGLFQGKNPAVWISNAYSNSGALGTVTGVAVGGAIPGLVFEPDVTKQPVPAGSPPAPSINVTDPNLKQPVSWKTNLAIDHKLPWGDIVATAEAGFLKVDEGLNTTFLNYVTSGITPDGRTRYAGTITPASSFVVSGITTLAQAQAAFGAGNVTAINATTGALTFVGSSVNGRRRVNTGGPTGTGFADVFYLTNTNKGQSTDFTASLHRALKNHWGWSAAWTHNYSTEVSPMTSSTASSNYSLRASFNPNEDVASTSNYQIKDRFVATLSYQFEVIKKAPTTVTAVYQGRSGRPYSWVFFGDANGDGFTFNDLLYVPTGPSDPRVAWASTAERDAFFTFAEQNGLMKYAGTHVARNSAASPWLNTVDLQFTQAIPLGIGDGTFRNLRAELYVNILNFAYLLNKHWGGIQDEVPFSYRRAVVATTYNAATNQYVYTYNNTTLNPVPVTVNDTPISRWQVQAGLRLKF